MAEVLYTLTVSKDVYSITNNEAEPIDYSMEEGGECKPSTVISLGTIDAGVTWIVPLSKDGKYVITLLSQEFAPNESIIEIDYFLNLQESMIQDIQSVLCPCDCGCAGCTDLGTEQLSLMMTARNKIDIYLYATAPKYDEALQAVHEGSICLILPQVYCDIATEGVTGQDQYNEKLTMQLIALDYLAMLFWDLKGVTDPEEIEYINEKYKSEEILCCISKLGIDINAIKQIIDDIVIV